MSWALITGAAQGIGRAIALEMAQAGWDIVVHYHTSQSEAEQTATDIQALGRQACLAELDLANGHLVEQLLPSLTGELGPIGALINNASVFLPDSIMKDKRQHHLINAEAPALLSEAFFRQTPQGGNGAIVNLLDADPTGPAFSLYNASKQELAALTLVTAQRFAPAVRVNGVALGPVMRNPRQSEDHFQKLVDATPLGKPIAPADIAKAVRFLIEMPTISGAILPVDGGLHLKVPKA